VVRAVALTAGLVMVASACGGGSSKSSGSSQTTTPATVGGLTGGVETGTPVPGGSLVYGIEADTSGGFCLYKAQLAIGGIEVVGSVYDTLTAPDGNGKIQPYLAESVTPNPNYTVWTIKLRANIKFHDGTALTADVVKENLDHFRHDNPLFVFVFGDVKSIDVVDPLTLTVSTKRPWSAFPWFLWSSGRLGIMAKAQMDSPNCNTMLIGTGPFVFKSWKFGDKFVATRNPNYWRKDKNGKQLPYLDQITFVPQEDSAKRTTSLESGDFQMIHTDDPLQIVQIRKDVQSNTLKDIESTKFAELGYMMLNVTKPPFNHLAARQAVAYAIDRDTYNKLRNDNILQNASGPFAPGAQGYVADSGLPTFDPAKAKAAAALYKQQTGKDLTFTLSHTADPSTTQDAVLVQQMLKQNAGITINLNPVPDQSTLINLAVGRQYDANLWRNHPGADADTQYVWWHCNNSPPAGTDPNGAAACDNPINFGGFNDPVINNALDQARVASSPAAREALYQSVTKEFAKELWNLWSQWTMWVVAYKPNVHGALGPGLPNGEPPFTGLATGNPVSGIWCDNGKC